MAKDNKKPADNTIALNKKARHDYILETRYEAGIALQGWEVKSARSGKVQLRDSYILMQNGEAFLFGTHISPLPTVSTHIVPEQQRNRKLLLHRSELNKIHGAIERKGYSVVPTAMYWKNGKIKLEIALARGKKAHDKRQDLKQRDWDREKERMFKKG